MDPKVNISHTVPPTEVVDLRLLLDTVTVDVMTLACDVVQYWASQPNVRIFLGLAVECWPDMRQFLNLRHSRVTTFDVRSVGSDACQSIAAEDGMILWIQWSMGLACLTWVLVGKLPVMSCG